MHPFENPAKRVLLVVQEEPLQEEIAEFLVSTERFQVLRCSGHDDALKTLQGTSRIDVIVSDFEAISQGSELSRTAIRDGIPTIVLARDFEAAVKALRSYALKIPVLKLPIDNTKLAHLLLQYTGGTKTGGAPVMAAWWEDPESDGSTKKLRCFLRKANGALRFGAPRWSVHF